MTIEEIKNLEMIGSNKEFIYNKWSPIIDTLLSDRQELNIHKNFLCSFAEFWSILDSIYNHVWQYTGNRSSLAVAPDTVTNKESNIIMSLPLALKIVKKLLLANIRIENFDSYIRRKNLIRNIHSLYMINDELIDHEYVSNNIKDYTINIPFNKNDNSISYAREINDIIRDRICDEILNLMKTENTLIPFFLFKKVTVGETNIEIVNALIIT